MKSFYIGDIEIGGDQVVVIPEIGINHNGSLSVAKEMVDAAYRAGARIIKHQTHIVDDEMSPEAKGIIPGNSDESIYDIMSKCALGKDDEFELMNYVNKKGMEFISTPFSRAAADRLEGFGVKAYKIGSGEMNNYPLIEHISEFGKPMIVSTGMNSIKEVSKTVNILEKHGISFALMHTTNLYPTLPDQVRLGAMEELMREFPNVPIGLSDHTTSNLACFAGISLGAKIVERHFTDTMDRQGPDIVCSMDENQCRELINGSKEIPLMLGGKKEALASEKVTSDFAFASVCTIKYIKKGELFSKENIWVKRPGTGDYNAESFKMILGRKAAVDISEGCQLKKGMIIEGT